MLAVRCLAILLSVLYLERVHAFAEALLGKKKTDLTVVQKTRDDALALQHNSNADDLFLLPGGLCFAVFRRTHLKKLGQSIGQNSNP